MMKMAWKLIKNKKKWNIFFIGLFAILYASCFLINDIFFSTQFSILNLNQRRYGAHHGIFFDVDQKNIKQKSKVNIKDDGWIGLLGDYGIQGRKAEVTVGYFDEKASKMNPLKILSGRMPKKESEIAVEKSKLKKFGDHVKLGSPIVLKSEKGIERTFRICGIVEDYTGRWNVPEHLETGTNALPEVFVSSKAYIAKHYHYIFQYRFRGNTYDSSKIRELADTFGVSEENVVCNQKTYVEGMDVIKGLTIIQRIFLVVLCLLILILEICLLPVYYEKYRNSYQIFSYCGMKKADLLRLKGIHYLLLECMILIQTSIIYGCVSLLIRKFCLKSYHFAIPYFLLAVMLAFLTGGFYIFTFWKREEKSCFRICYQEDKSLEWNFVRICFKKGWRLFVPVIAAYIMFFTSMFYSLAYLNDYNWGDWDEYPDFSMAAETTSVSVISGDYEIYQDKEQYFSYDEIQKLEQIQGISLIEKQPYTNGISLDLKKDQKDEYWESYHTKEEAVLDIVKSENILPIYGLEYQVLNSEEIKDMKKSYPQYHFEKLLQRDQIIMFLPDKKQTSIKKGMEVSFGEIKYDGKKDLMELTVDDVWRKTMKRKVAEVIKSPVNLQISKIKINSKKPTVFMWEQNAKEMIKGYYKVHVFLDQHVTRAQYQRIQDTMQSMAAMHTDFMWSSKVEQQKESNEVNQTVQLPLSIFVVDMMVTLVSLFFLTCLMHLKQMEHQIYIFRIYGMKEKQMEKSFGLELGCFESIALFGLLLGIAGILWIYSIGISLEYLKIIGILICILLVSWFVCGEILKKILRRNTSFYF